MLKQPLVSVIALSYHHERFVRDALGSVIQQTYPNIELVLVDDGSTDDSVAVAKKFLHANAARFPVKKLFLPQNLGNCAAFNRGLALAEGKYIIDFSTDDIMLPQRIEQQVAFFESLPEEYGVIFSEAEYIDEERNHLGYHHQDKLKHLHPVPEGDVYADVLAYYFISPPTMMVRKQVLDDLGGYDERLAYEDFDFWVRSARKWKYGYLDQCTTRVRKHKDSKSAQQYLAGDRQLHSTYLVCRKAHGLNQTDGEQRALVTRLKYELRQALAFNHTREAELMLDLLRQLNTTTSFYHVLLLLTKMRFPVHLSRRIYQYICQL